MHRPDRDSRLPSHLLEHGRPGQVVPGEAVATRIKDELVGRIATRIEAPDAAFRASLVASQIAGVLVARYVLQLPALAGASVDEIVARVGPTVQRYLFD